MAESSFERQRNELDRPISYDTAAYLPIFPRGRRSSNSTVPRELAELWLFSRGYSRLTGASRVARWRLRKAEVPQDVRMISSKKTTCSHARIPIQPSVRWERSDEVEGDRSTSVGKRRKTLRVFHEDDITGFFYFLVAVAFSVT